MYGITFARIQARRRRIHPFQGLKPSDSYLWGQNRKPRELGCRWRVGAIPRDNSIGREPTPLRGRWPCGFESRSQGANAPLSFTGRARGTRQARGNPPGPTGGSARPQHQIHSWGSGTDEETKSYRVVRGAPMERNVLQPYQGRTYNVCRKESLELRDLPALRPNRRESDCTGADV